MLPEEIKEACKQKKIDQFLEYFNNIGTLEKLNCIKEGYWRHFEYQDQIVIFDSLPDLSFQLQAPVSLYYKSRVAQQDYERERQELLHKHAMRLFPVTPLSQIELEAYVSMISSVTQFLNLQRSEDRYLLSILLIRVHKDVIKHPSIAYLTAYMITDEFHLLLKKLPFQDFPDIFFTINPRDGSHTLVNIYKIHGGYELCRIHRLLLREHEERWAMELRSKYQNGPLFEQFLGPDPQVCDLVLDVIIDELKDREKQAYLIRFISKLNIKTIFSLVTSMSQYSREGIFLMRLTEPGQPFFTEKLAQCCGSDPKQLHLFLDLIYRSTNLFRLLSEPFQYGTTKVFAASPIRNSAVKSFTTLLSHVPGVGSSLQHSLNSFQQEVILTEFFIFQLFRANEALVGEIPNLLSEMSPKERRVMLSATDRDGKSLLIYFLTNNIKLVIINVLAEVDFAAKDDDKIIDPANLNLIFLRETLKEKEHPDRISLVGFIVFFTLYVYLAVRANEPNVQDYDDRLHDMKKLQQCIKENLEQRSLKKIVQQQLAQTTSMSGKRYHDARGKLLELSNDELREGFLLFEEFVNSRLSANRQLSTLDIKGLDERLLGGFRKKNSQSLL